MLVFFPETFFGGSQKNNGNIVCVIFRCTYYFRLTFLSFAVPSFCSKFQPLLPNSAAYFFATGGGYDKLEVYKCSDGVKTPAVTREMVIRFPSRMVSWRHEEFHMVIQMLRLNTHVHKHTHARVHIRINTHRRAHASLLGAANLLNQVILLLGNTSLCKLTVLVPRKLALVSLSGCNKSRRGGLITQ